jgi:hypothetical protein
MPPQAPEDQNDRRPEVQSVGKVSSSTSGGGPCRPTVLTPTCPTQAKSKSTPPVPPHNEGASVGCSPAPGHTWGICSVALALGAPADPSSNAVTRNQPGKELAPVRRPGPLDLTGRRSKGLCLRRKPCRLTSPNSTHRWTIASSTRPHARGPVVSLSAHATAERTRAPPPHRGPTLNPTTKSQAVFDRTFSDFTRRH